ncbi:unnamed protein product, partial [Mesorhabditis belari]|uniref:CX domain-containing protein n=1 Tax=Mesorhabditis belari TaxID=2138241 RepID=A0AAF3J9G2_9BILA
MSSRWDELPISEQEQKYQASTTTTLPIASSSAAINSIRRNLGSLIRQEISDDQTICYYKNLHGDGSIPYLCELGCCPSGCCTPEDLTSQANGYGWAIGLLVAFILLVLFATAALFALWMLNRHKEKIQKRELQASSADSSAASQISGPTSYYSPETYFPYTYYESKY